MFPTQRDMTDDIQHIVKCALTNSQVSNFQKTRTLDWEQKMQTMTFAAFRVERRSPPKMMP